MTESTAARVAVAASMTCICTQRESVRLCIHQSNAVQIYVACTPSPNRRLTAQQNRAHPLRMNPIVNQF